MLELNVLEVRVEEEDGEPVAKLVPVLICSVIQGHASFPDEEGSK